MDDSDTIEFIRESLALFGIDGVLEIKSHFNFAYEVNLITNVDAIHQKNQLKRSILTTKVNGCRSFTKNQ